MINSPLQQLLMTNFEEEYSPPVMNMEPNAKNLSCRKIFKNQAEAILSRHVHNIPSKIERKRKPPFIEMKEIFDVAALRHEFCLVV